MGEGQAGLVGWSAGQVRQGGRLCRAQRGVNTPWGAPEAPELERAVAGTVSAGTRCLSGGWGRVHGWGSGGRRPSYLGLRHHTLPEQAVQQLLG